MSSKTLLREFNLLWKRKYFVGILQNVKIPYRIIFPIRALDIRLTLRLFSWLRLIFES